MRSFARLALLIALLPFSAGAAPLTRSALKSEMASALPDNTTNSITPAILRTQLGLITDSGLMPSSDLPASGIVYISSNGSMQPVGYGSGFAFGGGVLSYVPTWSGITGKPPFAAVALSGAYSDLIGAPPLSAAALSGSYLDLINKPAIPTNTNQLTNGAGFITGAGAPVQSVFNRTGAIMAAAGDYSVSQVTGAAPAANPAFTGTVKLPVASTLLKTDASGAVTPALAGTDYQPAGSYLTSLNGARRALFTQVAGKTIGNTTSPTSALTTPITLPANFLATGRTITMVADGYYSAAALAPSLNMAIKLGSTTIATTTVSNLLSGAQGKMFRAVLAITCRTVGTSGTVVANGAVTIDTGSSAGENVFPITSGPTPVVVDTTSAMTLDDILTWGSASASNTLTIMDQMVEFQN